MSEVVWIEEIADGSGYWAKVQESERFPDGRATQVHGWRSMHDAHSLEALDLVLIVWGLHRQGPIHKDEDGRIYVTIAPSAEA